MADKTATEEQRRYATILDIGMKAGLLLLIITFVLYLVGFPKPAVERSNVSDYWGMKVDEYLEATGAQKGWGWLGDLDKGDFLNFVPIAFLAAVTAICYLSIVPIFIRKKDLIFTILVILEVLVLVLAASGVLPSGGH